MSLKFSRCLPWILALNLFGVLLFFSDWYTSTGGFWFDVDSAIFHFFNERLIPGSWFLRVTAISNVRAFDVVSFLAMLGLYYAWYRRADVSGKRRLICVGLLMLLTAIVIKWLDRYLPISHPSPSLYFTDAVRLSSLTSLPAKDYSGNSFPGDHGMMLMIFAAFALRYLGRRAFGWACLLVVIFSMPRIMSGVHWFSDVYAGSLSIACIALSWLLLTPLSDWIVAGLNRLIFGLLVPDRLAARLGLGLNAKSNRPWPE